MSGNGSAPLGEAEYADLVARIQAAVAASVPSGASVLMISKGDAALLEMPGLSAAHFPQDSAGGYAGHHPLDSATATAEVEELRRRGAEYLVIPATARWWLEHYEGFAMHLATHAELVADLPDSCLIYGLGQLGRDSAAAPSVERPRASVDQVRDYLQSLIPADTTLVVLEPTDDVAAALAPLSAVGLSVAEAAAGDAEPLLGDLKRLAEGGAGYLVVPRSADSWLEQRAEIAARIEASCPKVADQRHLCRVFDLGALCEAAA
jgi:hypothetical protein